MTKRKGPREGEKRKSVFSFPPLVVSLRTNFRRERGVWYEAERKPVTGPTPGYAHKENRDNRDSA